MAMAFTQNTRHASLAMEQRAHAYAALVEDCERVADEAGGAEAMLCGLHG